MSECGDSLEQLEGKRKRYGGDTSRMAGESVWETERQEKKQRERERGVER